MVMTGHRIVVARRVVLEDEMGTAPADAVQGDRGPPLLLPRIPLDPLVDRSAAAAARTVQRVPRPADHTEVRPGVVESVSVAVIDIHSGRSVEQQPVHQDLSPPRDGRPRIATTV